MQDEELHEQEEGFGGESIGEEILDVFEDESHVSDDDDALPHHDEDDEEADLFDFFGDEDDRDSMY